MNLPQVHEPSVPDPANLPASNEGGLSVLGVGNDADAVAMWLRARGSRSENTARTYARCSDRLLQWCRERGMTLAEMSVADAQEHLDTLRNPDSRWLIPRDADGKLLKPLYKSQFWLIGNQAFIRHPGDAKAAAITTNSFCSEAVGLAGAASAGRSRSGGIATGTTLRR